MSATPSVPVLSLLDSAEAVFRAQGKYRFVQRWAILTSVWAMAALVPLLLLLFLDLGDVADLVGTIWVIVLVIGSVIFSLLSPFAIGHAMKATRTLRDFLKDFYPVWYKVKFEVLPPVGANVDEQTLNKLAELHPFLRKAQVRYNAEIRGRGGSHRFAVYARRGIGPPVPFPPGNLAVVRRFDGPAATTVAELRKLKEDALDVAKKTGDILSVLAAVSMSGFEPDAVEWARSPDGLSVKSVGSSLLNYQDGKFTVVFAG